MEAWKRRYNDRQHEIYLGIRKKLLKSNRPGYIRPEIFNEVVDEIAMKLAYKYMTSLRQGDRNV